MIGCYNALWDFKLRWNTSKQQTCLDCGPLSCNFVNYLTKNCNFANYLIDQCFRKLFRSEFDIKPNNLTVFLRTTTLTPLDADHVRVGVASFVIHPGYNETTFVNAHRLKDFELMFSTSNLDL